MITVFIESFNFLIKCSIHFKYPIEFLIFWLHRNHFNTWKTFCVLKWLKYSIKKAYFWNSMQTFVSYIPLFGQKMFSWNHFTFGMTLKFVHCYSYETPTLLINNDLYKALICFNFFSRTKLLHFEFFQELKNQIT